MIRKYHNHKLQTTPWHREEEPLKTAYFIKENLIKSVGEPDMTF